MPARKLLPPDIATRYRERGVWWFTRHLAHACMASYDWPVPPVLIHRPREGRRGYRPPRIRYDEAPAGDGPRWGIWPSDRPIPRGFRQTA